MRNFIICTLYHVTYEYSGDQISKDKVCDSHEKLLRKPQEKTIWEELDVGGMIILYEY